MCAGVKPRVGHLSFRTRLRNGLTPCNLRTVCPEEDGLQTFSAVIDSFSELEFIAARNNHQ